MRQQGFEFKTWGGKRKGAGRPPKGPRSSERHKRRPRHDKHHPVHVTLRVVPHVGRIRRRYGYRAVQWGLVVVLERKDFRICQASIQGNHIHLIVEADSAQALARGVKGFEVACARRINRELEREGQVFADRYHAVPLTSPRQVHHALGYVLNNWRKHHEDRELRGQVVDPYSSARGFDGWDRPIDRRIRPTDELLPVRFAETWLLTVGWRRHGRLSPVAH